MKRTILLLLILLNSFCGKSQTITHWKATTPERIYLVTLTETTFEIEIEYESKKYTYKYPLYGKIGKQYFKEYEEKMCVSVEQNILSIKYCDKVPIAVNEIVTITFKRQE